MTNASVWAPATSISGHTLSASERFVAAVAQKIFVLTSFIYTPYVGSIEVHRNGLLLGNAIDYTEDSNGNVITLTTPSTAGDVIIVTAHVGIAALAPNVSGGSVIQEFAPTTVFFGLRWIRCTDMKSFTWYVDEDSAQWVEDHPSRGAATHDSYAATTVNRPTVGLYIGFQFFDVTLGYPIWWSGTDWINSLGSIV